MCRATKVRRSGDLQESKLDLRLTKEMRYTSARTWVVIDWPSWDRRGIYLLK
jgi:hypothetical protein